MKKIYRTQKYWVLAAIKDHISGVKDGFDMSDFSFGIKYKDGTEVFVYGNELPETKIRISEKYVAYCWESNPCDSSDSLGKTWLRDFSHLEDSFQEWDEYIGAMMEQM